MNFDQLRKFIEPLKRRVMMMVGRAMIKSTNDTGPLQTMQVGINKDEVREGVQRVQEYGFTSRPKPGAEAFVAFLGGNRDHGVVIAVDDRRYRLKPLAEGEVAIYTDEGDKIHLKRGRVIDIVTETLNIQATTKVSVTTPLFEVTASSKAAFTTPMIEASQHITAGGHVSDATGTMQGIRDTYNSHTHNENNVNGGPTNVPNQPMN